MLKAPALVLALFVGAAAQAMDSPDVGVPWLYPGFAVLAFVWSGALEKIYTPILATQQQLSPWCRVSNFRHSDAPTPHFPTPTTHTALRVQTASQWDLPSLRIPFRRNPHLTSHPRHHWRSGRFVRDRRQRRGQLVLHGSRIWHAQPPAGRRCCAVPPLHQPRFKTVRAI